MMVPMASQKAVRTLDQVRIILLVFVVDCRNEDPVGKKKLANTTKTHIIRDFVVPLSDVVGINM
jgi:hypothetical protein